jgi:hypothetical protein
MQHIEGKREEKLGGKRAGRLRKTALCFILPYSEYTRLDLCTVVYVLLFSRSDLLG